MKILIDIKDIGLYPLPINIIKLSNKQQDELEDELGKTFRYLMKSTTDADKQKPDFFTGKVVNYLNMCCQNYINKVNREKQIPTLLIPK